MANRPGVRFAKKQDSTSTEMQDGTKVKDHRRAPEKERERERSDTLPT